MSCNESPTVLHPIEVTYPGFTDVWMYMQGNTHVEWSGAEGESVRIDIYRNDEFFLEYLGWVPNNGYATRTGYLHPACHGSGYYQIRVEDDAGNSGISDYFTIMCGGIGDITITYPRGVPVWTYAGSDAYVTWTDSDAEMVRVHVYGGDGTNLDILIDWTENDGYAEPPYPLDSSLIAGAYYIEITDDRGEWGIGGDFVIQ
jgi:hypothetical protein